MSLKILASLRQRVAAPIADRILMYGICVPVAAIHRKRDVEGAVPYKYNCLFVIQIFSETFHLANAVFLRNDDSVQNRL